MNDITASQQAFEELRVCVLVPTFNNAATLPALLQDILQYTPHILVVNDGSTDETIQVLSGFDHIQVVSYERNRGKGYALRKGFEAAVARGYAYAITIDSDGQHYAADLPVFLDALRQNPGSLLIGARNMNQSAVPSKSSFGNRFSNFWFLVETGIRLPDTQSGYRLYPVERLASMQFFTRKYEFEIEVIVRAAWKKIPVLAVPVRVYYPPPGERISHFRPFRDFTRISLLNTVLVILAWGYFRPRNFLLSLFRKNGFREHFIDPLFDPQQSPARKACSAGFGIFMGIIPIWGFQLVVAIFLAVLLKLNKALVIIFANISIPPMIPLIIYGSYRAGAFWTHHPGIPLSLTKNLSLHAIQINFRQYLVGSISLALVAGILTGGVIFVLLSLTKRKTGAVTGT